MSPTDTKKCAKKLRGFTLIEMLVVIAIIAILAGMISLAIGGFQRDARMEADNNKARIAYTGFQNALIQCEINQDVSMFDARAITSSSVDGEDLTYAHVVFNMKNSALSGGITVYGIYANSTSKNKGVILSSGKEYDELKKIILSFLDNSFEGMVTAYIDIENYTVDSVLYYESDTYISSDLNGSKTMVKTAPTGISAYYITGASAPGNGKIFQTIGDYTEQKKIVKKGIYCGAYPMVKELAFAYGEDVGYGKASI